MAEPDFAALEQQLLQGGVVPAIARRTAHELREHYEDLCDDLAREGMSQELARVEAARRLGSVDDVAQCATNKVELRRWMYRYPMLGRVALPLACALALPAAPLIAGANYAPAIARWGVILSLSAVVTASMFLAIQLTITLG